MSDEKDTERGRRPELPTASRSREIPEPARRVWAVSGGAARSLRDFYAESDVFVDARASKA